VKLINALNLTLLLCALLASSHADSKATVVTLLELIEESQLIIYGHLDIANSPPVFSPTRLRFTAVQLLKGRTSAREDIVLLCNRRPNAEWPDLSKLAGDAVLFLVQSGDCYNLSHNYRSVVKVHGDRATTGAIKDQPDEQTVDEFLQKLRMIDGSK
jgi:hypothetical protein